jgi:hypothetical protein
MWLQCMRAYHSSLRIARLRSISPTLPGRPPLAGRRGSPSVRWTGLTIILLLSLSASGNLLLSPSNPSSIHDQFAGPRGAVPRVIKTGNLEGPVNPFININVAYS